jgi:ATP-dependent exoDNAse (exonuclease V) beta subunit
VPLSKEQTAAVTRAGQDACCAAGPGSGKTRVLVERIAWLVDQGRDPERILAITFTEKAAREIKSRLVARFSPRRDLREKIERTPVSTIHSFCRSLLGEHALRCGLDPSFRVLDEREARALTHAALRAVLDRYATGRREEFRALIDAWAATEPLSEIASLHERFRSQMAAGETPLRAPEFDWEARREAILAEVRGLLESAPPARTAAQSRRIAKLREWLEGVDRPDGLAWLAELKRIDKRGLKPGDAVHDTLTRVSIMVAQARAELIGAMFRQERATLHSILEEFDAEYRLRKRQSSAADFGDLEEYALALLRSAADVRRQTRDRYEAILMDELQDTNPIQWSIVDLIRTPGAFFAVGDINQSIFGFRGADPSLFERYEASLRGAGLALDTLEENYRSRAPILDAVAAVLPRLQGVRPHRLASRGEFDTPDGVCVEILSVDGDGEAMWVARRIRELIAEGPFTRWSDYAVLVRAATSFEKLEEAFEWFHIPFVLERGRSFFEEPEILDLANCLRVQLNPADGIALFALLRSPLFGVSDEEIYRLSLSGRSAPEWAEARINALRQRTGEEPADALLAELLDETGYLRRAGPRAEANVRKFLRILRGLEREQGADLALCLQRLDEIAASGKESNAPAAGLIDAVQLLTVHRAKGLEFPVVFLTAMHRRPGGRPPSLNLSSNGLGVRWREPGTPDSLADALYQANCTLEDRRAGMEEDRLLYVAMTRARERLVLTWTAGTERPHTWVKPVEAALVPRWPEAPGTPLIEGHRRILRVAGVPDSEAPAPAAPAGAVEVELPRLPPGHHPPSAVAVTAVAAFEECPRRYFLSNLCGWPQPDPPPAAAFGSEVHKVLGGDAAGASEEARSLARAFTESPLGRRAAAAARVEREFDFIVEYGGVLLRGAIDLWFEDRQGSVLADYKTDRDVPAEKFAAYKAQLEHYAAVLAKLRGAPPDRAFLFLLRQGAAVEVPLDEGFMEACSRRIAALLEAHRSGEFPLKAGSHCRVCPYWRRACPGLNAGHDEPAADGWR